MVTQVAIDHPQCRRAIGVELSETRHNAGEAALAADLLAKSQTLYELRTSPKVWRTRR